jgi:hypothetical protein
VELLYDVGEGWWCTLIRVLVESLPSVSSSIQLLMKCHLTGYALQDFDTTFTPLTGCVADCRFLSTFENSDQNPPDYSSKIGCIIEFSRGNLPLSHHHLRDSSFHRRNTDSRLIRSSHPMSMSLGE